METKKVTHHVPWLVGILLLPVLLACIVLLAGGMLIVVTGAALIGKLTWTETGKA